MDEELKELESHDGDSRGWRENQKLVFYILSDLNTKYNKLEEAQIAMRLRMATWGAIGGFIGWFIPFVISLIKIK